MSYLNYILILFFNLGYKSINKIKHTTRVAKLYGILYHKLLSNGALNAYHPAIK